MRVTVQSSTAVFRYVECSRTHTRRPQILESSGFLSEFIPVSSAPQVDDDGESYWVFESRDVRFSPTYRLV